MEELFKKIAQNKILTIALVVLFIVLSTIGSSLIGLFKSDSSANHNELNNINNNGSMEVSISGGLQYSIAFSSYVEYEKHIKERITEKTRELEQTTKEDKQRIKTLTLQLQDLQYKVSNGAESFEIFKQLATERQAELDALKDGLPKAIITKAQEYIAQDEFEAADALLDQARAEQTQQLAQTLFVQAQLNKDALNYYKAYELSIQAIALEPNSDLYLNQAGFQAATLGEYEQALKYYSQALEISIKRESHSHVAILKNNIGLVFKALGKYEQALELFRDALEKDIIFYGESHPKVAIRKNNIGLVYEALGEYYKALDYYKQALEISINRDSHLQMAIYKNNIGMVYKELSEYDKALKYFKEALEIDITNYVESHPNLAIRKNNIGGVHEALGEYDRAMESYQEALEIFKLSFDDDHPNIQIVQHNIKQLRQQYDTQ